LPVRRDGLFDGMEIPEREPRPKCGKEPFASGFPIHGISGGHQPEFREDPGVGCSRNSLRLMDQCIHQ
ncbi:MAG: hypothetical protein ACPF97_06185, partial [Ilumatobacteraceae bacterium]